MKLNWDPFFECWRGVSGARWQTGKIGQSEPERTLGRCGKLACLNQPTDLGTCDQPNCGKQKKRKKKRSKRTKSWAAPSEKWAPWERDRSVHLHSLLTGRCWSSRKGEDGERTGRKGQPYSLPHAASIRHPRLCTMQEARGGRGRECALLKCVQLDSIGLERSARYGFRPCDICGFFLSPICGCVCVFYSRGTSSNPIARCRWVSSAWWRSLPGSRRVTGN